MRRQGSVKALGTACAILAIMCGGIVLMAGGWPRASNPGNSPDASLLPTATAGAASPVAPSASPAATGLLACFGDEPGFEPDKLTSAPEDAEKANTPQAAALRALLATPAGQILPASGWRLVSESASQVMFLAARTGGSEMPFGSARFVLGSGGWVPISWGDCRLAALPPLGYGIANWTLDPAVTLTPATTDLHILVDELQCHGLSDAAGRIAVEARVSGASLVLTSFVRSLNGPQTCPGTPPTPYVVHLDQPLGNRTVLDGATWPMTERISDGKASPTGSEPS
jgi:hypothetical protein